MEIYAPAAPSVASALLEIEAIKIQPDNPFTWASGWKSPIYCDNRLSLSFPAIRSMIKERLAAVVKEKFPGAEAIGGVATAGIPQGALVADVLDLPFVYIRSKAKGHGMGNKIEGKITPGQKVVLVEDLVSTGGSSLQAAEALREVDMEVLGMLAIFTYGFDVARQNFENAGIPLVCLSDYSYLLDEAVEKKYIDDSDLSSLQEWRENPSDWKP